MSYTLKYPKPDEEGNYVIASVIHSDDDLLTVGVETFIVMDGKRITEEAEGEEIPIRGLTYVFRNVIVKSNIDGSYEVTFDLILK